MSARQAWSSSLQFAAVGAAFALSGCATNPATGQRQFSLVSEGQEIQMGQQSDPEIVKSLGLYEDQRIQAYVARVGKKLSAVSERPNLPWTFRVVNDHVVNAFAVPGGFVYVTRGILTHLTSEAQLASVMGHETGHVTARHSAQQMTKQQVAQIGLVAGAIIAPKEFEQFGGLAQAATQMLFLKFSRDDEYQADELGLRYIRRVAYDPRPMVKVFSMLDRLTGQAGQRIPEWQATHPDPGNRASRLSQMIASIPKDSLGRTVGDAEYLSVIDGMVYGENPREGFFRDNVFLHPDLAFRIDFPAGWKTANQKEAVLAAPPEGDAMLQVSFAPEPTPEQAAQAFAQQQGIQAGSASRTTINGLPAATLEFQGQAQNGTALQGIATFIQHGQGVYGLLGYGVATNWGRYAGVVQRSMRSFMRLTDPAALNVRPNRLKIERSPRALSLAQFNQQFPSEIPIEELALINQMDTTTLLVQGASVKRVVKE